MKKQINPKFDEFIMKVDVEHFGYNNLLQDFKFMKSVKITMDVWWNSRRKENVYKKKDSYIQRSYFWKYYYIWEWHLKFVGFLRDITEDDRNNDRTFLKYIYIYIMDICKNVIANMYLTERNI